MDMSPELEAIMRRRRIKADIEKGIDEYDDQAQSINNTATNASSNLPERLPKQTKFQSFPPRSVPPRHKVTPSTPPSHKRYASPRSTPRSYSKPSLQKTSNSSQPSFGDKHKFPPWINRVPPPPPPPGPPPNKTKKSVLTTSPNRSSSFATSNTKELSSHNKAMKNSTFVKNRSVFLESSGNSTKPSIPFSRIGNPPLYTNNLSSGDNDSISSTEAYVPTMENMDEETDSFSEKIIEPPKLDLEQNRSNTSDEQSSIDGLDSPQTTKSPIDARISPERYSNDSSIDSSSMTTELTVQTKEVTSELLEIPEARPQTPVKAKVILKSCPLQLCKITVETPHPVLNPLTGNLICIRQKSPNITNSEITQAVFLDEVDVTNGAIIASTQILSMEFMKQFSSLQTTIDMDVEILLGISKVVSFTAGLHRHQGRCRVKVAAVLDLVLSTSQRDRRDVKQVIAVWHWGYATGRPIALQSLLSTPTLFQTTTIKPKNTPVAHYDPHTICLADGLLFIGGSTLLQKNQQRLKTFQRIACVYFAKPHVRETWSSVKIEDVSSDPLNQSPQIVTALAVTTHPNRYFKYLSVATNDGSLSIWKYDLAASTNRLNKEIKNPQSEKKKRQQRLIEFFCRLGGSSTFDNVAESIFVRKSDSFIEPEGEDMTFGSSITRYCTHMAWISPSTSSPLPLLLLAAAFTDGVAVYIVSPESEPQSSRTDSVAPIAIARAKLSAISYISNGGYEYSPYKSFVAWTDIGPSSPPCLSVLFQSQRNKEKNHKSSTVVPSGDEENVLSSRLFVGTLNFSYAGNLKTNPQLLNSIGISTLSERNSDIDPCGAIMNIVPSPSTSSIVCRYFDDNQLKAISPSLVYVETSSDESKSELELIRKSSDAFFTSLHHAVSSPALGIDSRGNIFKQSNMEDHDSIYHVFTQMITMPRKTASSAKTNEQFDWLSPVHRYWLCRTNVGDKKTDNQSFSPDVEGEGKSNEDEHVTRGATTSIICELTCCLNPDIGLTPNRIVKEFHGPHITVLFSPSIGCLGTLDDSEDFEENGLVSAHPLSFAIFNTKSLSKKKSSEFELFNGRDVIFLPNIESSQTNVLVLNRDGSTVYTISGYSEDNDINTNCLRGLRKSESTSISPIQKGSRIVDLVDWYRIFTFDSNSFQVAFVGKVRADERSLLTIGPEIHSESQKMSLTQTPSILLPKDNSPKLFLKQDEHVLTMISLPDPVGNRSSCFAIATQLRVMIVSKGSLSIISSVLSKLTSSVLIPIGSHCVAFSSAASSNGGGATRIRYLSCLERKYSDGVIATLPNPRFGYASTLLLAVRPDRFLYVSSHSSSRMVDLYEDESQIRVPIPITKPAFLLEPMIANALCQRENDGFDIAGNLELQSLLRKIMDKFGRRNTSFPHASNEGIGLKGSGITTKIFHMLKSYDCYQAGSFLLTGNFSVDSQAPSRILPGWIPMQVKAQSASFGKDARQVLVSGNSNLVNYVFNPQGSAQESLPDASSPSSMISSKLGLSAMKTGQTAEAMKFFDFAGSKTSERLLIDLVLSLQLEPNIDTETILRGIANSHHDKNLNDDEDNVKNTCHAIAALALDLRQRNSNQQIHLEEGECSKVDGGVLNVMKTLAPSQRHGKNLRRNRDQLMTLTESTVSSQNEIPSDQIWKNPQNDLEHVWQKGPFEDKEEILLLEKFDGWLGRRQPAIVGKEGVACAADTGEKFLADILLAAAQDENLEENAIDSYNDEQSKKKDWITGVGEGRTDEDNLSAYFRFSEGDSDEENNWTTEGISDLTKYAHKAVIYGNEYASLEPTTSSVDEGEPGKIKLLYDLVFNETFDFHGVAGLAVEVKRGDSLDVGMLHDQHSSRKRCSLELWYFLPEEQNGNTETILMRRSLNSDGSDLSKFCSASNVDEVLWELAVLPTAQLQFRTSGGSVITTNASESSHEEGRDNFNTSQVDDTQGLVSWRKDERGGWNHVCIVFSPCVDQKATEINVTIFMKGVKVSSFVASVSIPSFDPELYSDFDAVDKAMDRTVLLFGLSPISGFRMTEIRIWSCARSADDIKLMMYEYLSPAETKKKLKVKIRKKKNISSKNIALLPSPSKPGKLTKLPQPANNNSARHNPRNRRSRAQFGQEVEKTDQREKAKKTENSITTEHNVDDDVNEFDFVKGFEYNAPFNEFDVKDVRETLPNFDNRRGQDLNSPFNSEFQQFSTSEINTETQFPEFNEVSKENNEPAAFDVNFEEISGRPFVEHNEVGNFNFDTSFPPQDSKAEASTLDDSGSSMSDTSLLLEASSKHLSQEVRSGAAAALIRGPPATRHFGGNRGGLVSSLKNWKRKKGQQRKVNSIAICGVNKTVLYSYGQNPAGVIYPFGASGAITSDILEPNRSEYMCCYIAREKRLNVFDLITRSVVAGLQIPTKLNFWRYLPPETHGNNTLVFMLITPIGGFHWMPIGDDPKPKLIWKRSQEIQRKKIVSYEEGGCNGVVDFQARSTVALLLTSAGTSQSTLEAWCIPIGKSTTYSLSSDILGAALFCPPKLEKNTLAFTPLVCVVRNQIHPLSGDKITNLSILKLEQSEDNSLIGDDIMDNMVLDVNDEKYSKLERHTEPVMATGSYPYVFVLCLEHVIVVIFRKLGLILAFLYNGNDHITELGKKFVDHFVVDAAINRGDVKGEIVVILLLSLPDKNDGFIAEIQVSQVGALC